MKDRYLTLEDLEKINKRIDEVRDLVVKSKEPEYKEVVCRIDCGGIPGVKPTETYMTTEVDEVWINDNIGVFTKEKEYIGEYPNSLFITKSQAEHYKKVTLATPSHDFIREDEESLIIYDAVKNYNLGDEEVFLLYREGKYLGNFFADTLLEAG